MAFKSFLNSNLTSFDKSNLLDLIKVWDKAQKQFVQMSIDQLGGMLYEMRSKFLHKAEYVPISSRADMSLGYLGEKIYSFGNFQKIIDILERAIFRRFQDIEFKKEI